MVHVCDHSMKKLEAGRLGILSHRQLHGKLKPNLRYVRPHLSKNKKILVVIITTVTVATIVAK